MVEKCESVSPPAAGALLHPGKPVPLTCCRCGSDRLTRIRAVVRREMPGTPIRYTYVQARCRACGHETEFLVFADRYRVAQEDTDLETRLLLGCSCGGTLFENAPWTPDPPDRRQQRRLPRFDHRACQREDLVILFAGTALLSDTEPGNLIAGGGGGRIPTRRRSSPATGRRPPTAQWRPDCGRRHLHRHSGGRLDISGAGGASLLLGGHHDLSPAVLRRDGIELSSSIAGIEGLRCHVLP